MLNGSAHERAEMMVLEHGIRVQLAKEQAGILEQNKRESNELAQKAEIKPKQEQRSNFRQPF